MIAKLLITLAVPAALASSLLETASAGEARTVRVQIKPGADSAELTDRIKGGESVLYKLTASPPDASAPAKPATPRADAAVFIKEVSYRAMRFKVTSPATDADNRFTITPSGLQASNEPITVSVKGFVVDVQCDDMDGDDSPEVAVITREGKQERGCAFVFSTNAKKSLSEVNFRDVTDDAKLLNGYGGGDQYAFVENTFIRRFPLYSQGEKTGRTRVRTRSRRRAVDAAARAQSRPAQAARRRMVRG